MRNKKPNSRKVAYTRNTHGKHTTVSRAKREHNKKTKLRNAASTKNNVTRKSVRKAPNNTGSVQLSPEIMFSMRNIVNSATLPKRADHMESATEYEIVKTLVSLARNMNGKMLQVFWEMAAAHPQISRRAFMASISKSNAPSTLAKLYLNDRIRSKIRNDISELRVTATGNNDSIERFLATISHRPSWLYAWQLSGSTHNINSFV